MPLGWVLLGVLVLLYWLYNRFILKKFSLPKRVYIFAVIAFVLGAILEILLENALCSTGYFDKFHRMFYG